MSTNTGLHFRHFVQALKKNNDLIEIAQQVDLVHELGAIMRKCYTEKAPAPLFTNLKTRTNKNFFNLLGCPAGLTSRTKNEHSRLALHLNLPSETSIGEIQHTLAKVIKNKKVQPMVVDISEATFTKNTVVGDDIDLIEFPAPVLHPGDSGKYLTAGLLCLETPDRSSSNWSLSRSMIFDKNRITGMVSKPQQMGKVAYQWKDQGMNKVPFALCLGAPPAAVFSASMSIPENGSEMEFTGRILGQSLPLVRTDVSGLLVPADCEMVIEGMLNLDDLNDEGPFSDPFGYCFQQSPIKRPTYTVDSVSYKDDPVLPTYSPGLCTDESHTLLGVSISVTALTALQDAGLPVVDVFMPYESQGSWLAVKFDMKKLRKMNIDEKELSNVVGDILFDLDACSLTSEVILFSDDIDIFNFKDVIWGYTTRHAPVRLKS
ncbi:unnamed protein product [Ambrosiozyma monospora]|uniref:Unnamed protein product n=1 Tax=Ambrosiozyma monospora TaxID=43982 RepID=A0ACB5SYN5_AMBMO|nr:unnamed protein product [Ambrosiozyma monospora]